MNQTTINLMAVTVFIMTLSILLGPLVNLSPTIPAIATFAVLGIATLDSFSFQGRGGTVLMDWIAGFSPSHRERIVHHEAGHFLVAYLLGVGITGYTLTAWEALRQKQSGLGGVSFDDAELAVQLSQGTIAAQMLDRYCTIWMAGIAAETLVYSQAEGGADDRTKLAAVLNDIGFSRTASEQKQRFCALQAKNVIQENWSVYQDLVDAMRQRVSVSECNLLLERSLTVRG